MTVKKSKECAILLDREFYQDALVQLRLWGQDQDALSIVYKALRKVELLDSTGQHGGVDNVTAAAAATEDLCCSSLHDSSSESSVEFPQPPPPPVLAVSPSAGASRMPDVSLEGMLQKSSSQNQSSLLQLLEVHTYPYTFCVCVCVTCRISATQTPIYGRLVVTDLRLTVYWEIFVVKIFLWVS